jgi:nitroreductase
MFEAIQGRRSIKSFKPKPVDRAQLERLLELAALAPNHRMTEPWRFIVMGPEAKRGYGEIKGKIRAAKTEDPVAALAVFDKTVAQMEAVPAMVAFVQRLAANPRACWRRPPM